MPALMKLCELTVSIKALIATQLILIFKMVFERNLGDIVDSILVVRVTHVAEQGRRKTGKF